ncbi:M16 family metallopeptidase [Methylophaga lonarensis]|uniref:M16 family metallopeptidase n=1 Tax=Methylophaga lonarensis TaxID=999151 RepID=UPI003D2D5266
MRNLKKWFLVTWLVLPVLVMADPVEYQLDNGLKLIVKPDTRSPVVVSQVWYKVGSSYEYNGITGISHMLEHMMFKGTENLEPNEFSRIIAANGGSENAFTSRDYTAYFQTLERDRLAVSFRHEADRMQNLLLDEAELLKEKEVVAEERRMRTDDNPRGLLYEAFSATAFMNSPYHHPVIGWMVDIEHYTIEDLQRWYDKWYAPNNATVVVVGDVDPEEVYQLALKYFGPVEAREVAVLKPQTEVPQNGKRYIEVRAPAELPSLMMGWKVPVIKTADIEWEPYALDVLAAVLDSGSSGRFARQLVRGEQVAAGVSARNNAFARLDEVFIISGTPAQGRTIEELKAAIMAQIETLQTSLVSEEELHRIKTQVIASSVYEQDSLFYQGMQIGILETIGLDWRLSDAYVDNINAVTAEQVLAVAQKYFVDHRLTVGELTPVSADENHSPANANGGHHAN